jgi:hypothetical protein
MLYIRAAA